MKAVTIDQVCSWTAGEILQQGNGDAVGHVTIDSRQAGAGSLFIPLKGESQDGHAFLCHSAKNGAAASLVRAGTELPESLPETMAVIQVKDCLEALQRLAKMYRDQFRLPVIAVTGSNGKTTTKDMIAAVLDVRFHVLKNQGNFNNHIGLPLTLLELDGRHESAVLEMGMSGTGEINLLSRLTRPDIAFVTNVGWAHVEKLGSREKIAAAKMEIVQGLQGNKELIINGDDPALAAAVKKLPDDINVVSVGLSETNDIKIRDINDLNGKGFSFSTDQTGSFVFQVNHPGIHHAVSGLFAVWTGKRFGLSNEEIQCGLTLFHPSGMRMEFVEVDQCLYINDAYNANPDSMAAAIRYLGSYPASRRIAVLGNMYELGRYAESCHRELAAHWLEAGIDQLITVGNMAEWTGLEALEKGASSDRVHIESDILQAVRRLKTEILPGDVILIKGSRAMEMEKIVYLMKEGDN
ncbi:MAG: UDP-N-acetylmuramoyl-tripeptide--D-alanyl-D-alanine ligase [Bacillota bacterium]|nr:UDP-N-acetylmuramoyl-tripeptide--D-alanyl-D-alanine ligase [Bacillota bacterium]MDW7676476.1 UDP-N-acetylmuramoyl-tripeptide--D-alanyl-D-alanine ligase [Bacillota bacterium]